MYGIGGSIEKEERRWLDQKFFLEKKRIFGSSRLTNTGSTAGSG